MRIGTVGSARPAFYDRNPATKNNDLTVSLVAPHGVTTRTSYTVPTGRKYQVTQFVEGLSQVNAATTVGQRASRFVQTPSGGALSNPLIAQLWASNVADNSRFLFGGMGPMLSPGDVVSSEDFDLGTGGTVDYFHNFTGVEFDA